ncbi:MAG: flagellar hook-basal body complex protein FliE [Paracoccaceae bacterium]
MEVKSNLASLLYSATRPATRPAEGASETGARPGGFARAAGDFVETLRHGEETAMAGLAGRADAMSVVEALAATELAVETAVTVRDRVVEAYQEILRMPV